MCAPSYDCSIPACERGTTCCRLPATCHPGDTPSVAPVAVKKKGLNKQAKLQAAGLTLRPWIKDCSPQASSVIDVCHIIHRLNKCSPPPPTTYYIFNTVAPPLPSVPAYSFASHQSTSQLLRFQCEGPSEEKEASGVRLTGEWKKRKKRKKGVKMLLAWKCSEIRQSQNRLLNKSC